MAQHGAPTSVGGETARGCTAVAGFLALQRGVPKMYCCLGLLCVGWQFQMCFSCMAPKIANPFKVKQVVYNVYRIKPSDNKTIPWTLLYIK